MLDIAGLKLKLVFSKIEWRNLFEKKFSNFVIRNQTVNRPDMKIIVKFLDSHRGGDTRFRYVNKTATEIFFPDSFRHFQLLNFAVKNSFAGILLRHNGCFIHASSAELNGKGILFVGVSGQGKSSIAKDLGTKILADDRSIIRWDCVNPNIYGSPFYEQHEFAKTKTVLPLTAIFLLNKRRVSKLTITKQPPREAIFRLVPHIIIREEENAAGRKAQLELGVKACQELAKSVPVYELLRPLGCRGAKLRKGLNEIIA